VNTFVCGVYEYVCNRVHVTEFLVTDWVIRTAGDRSLLRSTRHKARRFGYSKTGDRVAMEDDVA